MTTDKLFEGAEKLSRFGKHLTEKERQEKFRAGLVRMGIREKEEPPPPPDEVVQIEEPQAEEPSEEPDEVEEQPEEPTTFFEKQPSEEPVQEQEQTTIIEGPIPEQEPSKEELPKEPQPEQPKETPTPNQPRKKGEYNKDKAYNKSFVKRYVRKKAGFQIRSAYWLKLHNGYVTMIDSSIRRAKKDKKFALDAEHLVFKLVEIN